MNNDMNKSSCTLLQVKKKFRGLLESLDHTAQLQDVSCTVLYVHTCFYSVQKYVCVHAVERDCPLTFGSHRPVFLPLCNYLQGKLWFVLVAAPLSIPGYQNMCYMTKRNLIFQFFPASVGEHYHCPFCSAGLCFSGHPLEHRFFFRFS